MPGMNTMKECYMDARTRLHLTNGEIAEAYGRKKATIDRAIGSDKKFFKELYEKEHKKMEENKFEFEEEAEAVPVIQEEQAMQSAEEIEEPDNPDSVYEICTCCGKRFEIPLSEQDFFYNLGYPLPKRCRVCRKGRSEYTDFVCADCGEHYQMSASEMDYYKRNNLFVPKRCKACRDKRRNRLNKIREKNKRI